MYGGWNIVRMLHLVTTRHHLASHVLTWIMMLRLHRRRVILAHLIRVILSRNSRCSLHLPWVVARRHMLLWHRIWRHMLMQVWLIVGIGCKMDRVRAKAVRMVRERRWTCQEAFWVRVRRIILESGRRCFDLGRLMAWVKACGHRRWKQATRIFSRICEIKREMTAGREKAETRLLQTSWRNRFTKELLR